MHRVQNYRSLENFVISKLTTINPANNLGYGVNAVIEQRQSLYS